MGYRTYLNLKIPQMTGFNSNVIKEVSDNEYY